MKRKGMTLKRIIVPCSHDGELQRDEWIPAFAGDDSKENNVNDRKDVSLSSSTCLMTAGKNQASFL